MPSSSYLSLSMFDSEIQSICTKYTNNFAEKVVLNRAELEDTSKLSRLKSGCEVLFCNFLDISAKL